MGQLILPEATIGIIGGGQLGKMLSNAAQTLGYKVIIWSEEGDCPACRVATSTIVGNYHDSDILKEFVDQVDVVTVETEHIPLFTLQNVENEVPLLPRAEIVSIAQNRRKEKNWLSKNGIPVVPYQIITSIEEIIKFKEYMGTEIVVKTITGGYDGKGQLRISNSHLTTEEIKNIVNWLGSNEELIAEKWLPIESELSVIAGRNMEGSFKAFPVVENEHREHILHQTIAPARYKEELKDNAIKVTEEIMNKMDYVGLLCVEFFYGKDGKLYVNELAPRPHNSGHYTLDATLTSQFEQTIRTICGLPLGDTNLLSPCVMTNLLGDLWLDGFRMENILSDPMSKLHIYGKREARVKRKMGHFTTLARTVEEAIQFSKELYLSL